MPVTYLGRQFLTRSDVSGNVMLAEQELQRQIMFAENIAITEIGVMGIGSELQIRRRIAENLPGITAEENSFISANDWPIPANGFVDGVSFVDPSDIALNPPIVFDPAPDDQDIYTGDPNSIFVSQLTENERNNLRRSRQGSENIDFIGQGIPENSTSPSIEPSLPPEDIDFIGASVPSTTIKANGISTDATSKSNMGNGAFTTNIDNVRINPMPNELNQFSSYTYNIALWMLSPKQYIELTKYPHTFPQLPKFLVCRSGGIGSDYSEHFDLDFFIDNLSITNVAASPTRLAANTNAIDISFDIIEPRGVTLIERLKDQAALSIGEEENYITTPYVLEITFKGYNDEGKISTNTIKPKYIPIQIVQMKFSVDTSGAVYKLEAIPYNQNVFNSIRQTIPINLQIKANTVGNIFSNSAKTFNTESERNPSNDILTNESDANSGDSKNLASALNEYFRSLTKPRMITEIDEKTKNSVTKTVDSSDEIADQYEFVLSDEIYKAKMVTSNFDALNTPSETSRLFRHFGNAIKGNVDLDFSKQIFRVNAGTGIVNLINYIIISSDYIERNIIEDIESGRAQSSDRPIRWFKIKPKIIDFLGWDKKAGRYKYKVRWDVVPSNIYYNDFWFSPRNRPIGQGIHKVYNYIHSGLNIDVQDFKLDFDIAYYEAHTIGTGIPRSDKTANNTFNPQTKNNPHTKEGESVSSDVTLKRKRSKDLFSAIMHEGADLINLGLDIVGDPAFLPTGDGFWQDRELRGDLYNTPYLPDGTINYDLSPPYIQVNLKTPTEYDDETGLMDITKPRKYAHSEFGGVYQITEIKSIFSSGLFTQSLRGFRTHIQPIENTTGRSEDSNENTEREVKQGDDIDQPDIAIRKRIPRESLPLSLTPPSLRDPDDFDFVGSPVADDSVPVPNVRRYERVTGIENFNSDTTLIGEA